MTGYKQTRRPRVQESRLSVNKRAEQAVWNKVSFTLHAWHMHVPSRPRCYFYQVIQGHARDEQKVLLIFLLVSIGVASVAVLSCDVALVGATRFLLTSSLSPSSSSSSQVPDHELASSLPLFLCVFDLVHCLVIVCLSHS